MNDSQKFAYVLMSRADKERAIYVHKLNLIKQNLISKNPELAKDANAIELINSQLKNELATVH